MRDVKDLEIALKHVLIAMGENLSREGLRDTPKRAAKALMDLTAPKDFNFTTFDAEGTNELIVQTDIPMHSLCEHHMLPFMGTAAVAYIPDQRIVGLSKLARCVQYHSAGLQNQERITNSVADMLDYELKPRGVGVVIRARHLCMELRGVAVPNVWTTTSALKGVMFEDPRARAEFLALARR